MYFFLDLFDNAVPCDFDTWKATVGERGVELSKAFVSPTNDSRDAVLIVCRFTGKGGKPWEIKVVCRFFGEVKEIKEPFATRQEAIARHAELSERMQ